MSTEPRRSAVLLAWARRDGQERALAAALPAGWRTFNGFLRGGPSVGQAIRRAVAEGIEELVVVPMHPQFSPASTGALMRDLYGALGRYGRHLKVTARTTWYDDAAYVHALASRIVEQANDLHLGPEEARLRFLAPREWPAGDGPAEAFRRQVRRTCELVAGRIGWPGERWQLEFEGTPASAAPGAGPSPGPAGAPSEDRWLECRLPFAGGTPESTSDGVTACPSLVGYPPFVSALEHLVLYGPRRAAAQKDPHPLLEQRPGPSEPVTRPAALVMVGASLQGHLGGGCGPRLRYSDPGAFRRAKRSHQALRAFLDRVREDRSVCEAFVWNTCQRVEFYGWLSQPMDDAERAGLLERVKRGLFGGETAGLELNVLRAEEARRHLMRTACGLNSDLPGDRDVMAQLETALQTAERVRTGGPRAHGLVEESLNLAREVHAHTGWGDVSAGYCAAALARVCEVGGTEPERLHHVVVGGSTTSRSILSTLSHRYAVPAGQLTAVYRDHHGQMKRLRAALGNGRRLRVHAYSDRRVLGAIAEADFVFFGLDQSEPVLEIAALRALRDYGRRPLTIVDFNSRGSLDREEPPAGITLWSAKRLDEAVAAHTAITITRTGFVRALREAEDRIADYLASAGDSEDGGQRWGRMALPVRNPC